MPPARSRTRQTPPSSSILPHFVIGRTLGTVVVTARGELGGPSGGGLAALLDDLIDGQGNLSLVVDLGDVERLDDDAAAVLAGAARRACARGGTFRLARVGRGVARVLRRTGAWVTLPLDGPAVTPGARRGLELVWPSRRPRPQWRGGRPAPPSASMAPEDSSAQRPVVPARPLQPGLPGFFEVTVTRAEYGAHLELAGEIDTFTASLLREALARVVDWGAPRVVIGLGGLEFADSRFVHALVCGQGQLRARGGELYLQSPSRPIFRLLELSGCQGLIPIAPRTPPQ